MTRSGLLVALLLCTTPAGAGPHTRVSLDGRTDKAGPLDAAPVLHPTPQLPGLPVTWEGLLQPGAVMPVRDLCEAIGTGKLPDGGDLPVEPAQVLSKLVEQGVCDGEAG